MVYVSLLFPILLVVLRSLLTEDYSDVKLRCELALTDTTCFQQIEIVLPIERYHGPKHPDMPDFHPVNVHERDTILRHQTVILSRARDLDVQFLSSTLSNTNACEYGGYITKVARDQIHTVRHKIQTLTGNQTFRSINSENSNG